MRPAMLFNLLAIFMLVGNILDLFQQQNDWTPNVPTIIVSTIVIIILYIYMWKTPDRNVVRLKTIKPRISEEEYTKLKQRGPR